MKTEQEFWDDAILAAISNMAGRSDYGHDFPDMMINDAERIADALVERRSKRIFDRCEQCPLNAYMNSVRNNYDNEYGVSSGDKQV